ncbi:MAG: hypothetical protein KAR06_03455, partial [Deltaproteobacteria bacterium]|nr:hypothetical protein [Deltaproteobacteria bacterium]
RVTNMGNDTQDYSLAQAVNAVDPFGGTENFDATFLGIHLDDGNDLWDGTGTDLAGTCINNLLADDGAYSNYQTVWVRYSIGVQNDGDISAHTLTATSYEETGSCATTSLSVATASGTADSSLIEDVVIADVIPGDTDLTVDAAHSDTGAIQVASAIISIAKTVATVWDPINFASGGGSEPKAIPGAIVQYSITVSNDALASSTAVLTTIADVVPVNTTLVTNMYVPAESGPIGTLGVVGYCMSVLDSGGGARTAPTSWTLSCDGGDGDSDGLDDAWTLEFAGTGNGTALPADGASGHGDGDIAPDETVTITFQVTVN